MTMKLPWLSCFWFFVGLVLIKWVGVNSITEQSSVEPFHISEPTSNSLSVGLTLINGADAKGAGLTSISDPVCLDGTLPGYHLHRGYGSGSNSWLVQLEGGGWCDNVRNCVYRKNSRRGSSIHMEQNLAFIGILSNNVEDNPDFYNWNRVKLRYCDGASFTGDGEFQAAKLQFRGKRIWSVAMEDLMSKGMRSANQALLSGCSAGGLATILHCDEFRGMFPTSTRVKCLSDGGLFLDSRDISGRRPLRDLFRGVVSLQWVHKSLPEHCTNKYRNPTSCFFPQNVISGIKTPLFLINPAYDTWQIQFSLAPPSSDPRGHWQDCRLNHLECSPNQIEILQGFRNQLLNVVNDFSRLNGSGFFINSCFSHCQSERQDTWFSDDSPRIGNKTIAVAVGDWYFDRANVKAIDCPYPCDNTCHHLVFKKNH